MGFFSKLSGLSGWHRLSIFLSIMWMLFVLDASGVLQHEPYRNVQNMYEFLFGGIFPIFFFWNVFWIIKGFRKKI